MTLFYTIILWNKLPAKVVIATCDNLQSFKKNCNSYIIIFITDNLFLYQNMYVFLL